MKADLAAAVQAWKQAGCNGIKSTASSEKVSLDNSRRMRMIAGISYLAKYFTENPHIEFTNQQLLKHDWFSQKSPLYPHISEIYQYAPKLHFLQRILTETLRADEKLIVVIQLDGDSRYYNLCKSSWAFVDSVSFFSLHIFPKYWIECYLKICSVCFVADVTDLYKVYKSFSKARSKERGRMFSRWLESGKP